MNRAVAALVVLVAAPVTDLVGLPRVELLDTPWSAVVGIVLDPAQR